MTRDDIIQMAREAGAGEPESLYGRTDYVVMTRSELEYFAELVRADEREACAKVCDEYDGSWYAYRKGAQECAAAIRARGETK